jgi:hypothetical protein
MDRACAYNFLVGSLGKETRMRKNLAVLLAGVLIGGMLFLAYPSPAATTAQRLRKLEGKVETLQKKTRFMTRQGDYRSFIGGDQVLSLCAEGTPATWFDEVDDITILDACIPAPMSAQQFRQRLGQR